MKKPGGALKINMLFAAIAALLLAGTVLVNGIVLLLSGRYPLYIDLTANASYEIGDTTKALLGGLEQPVEISVLATEDGFKGSAYLQQALRILKQYPRHSTQISLRFVDFAADPTFGVQYPDFALSYGDVLVQSGGTVKQITAANLFHYAYSLDKTLTIQASRAEEAVTSAIVYTVSGRQAKIAVLTGNGVTDAKLFTALLADNNYQLSPQNLTTATLDGFDAALLLAPTTDLSEDVVRGLEAFLYNGGAYGKTLFYAASASQGALPNLDAFLREWGVAFGEGAIFETKSERTYQYQPYYPTALYEKTKYTDLLKDSTTPFLLPLSRPMELLFQSKDGYYVAPLLYFSETSGVRPADAGEDFTADTAQVRGPLPAMVLASYNSSSPGDTQTSSYIVVSTSVGIFDAAALQNSSLTNAEYLLHLLGDLCGESDSIPIQPKSLSGQTLGINTAQMSGLGVVLVGVIPLLILSAGVGVWLLRRYR